MGSSGFVSEKQRRIFNDVLAALDGAGYRGERLRRNYPYSDWFADDVPRRVVPAAAFGRIPCAYDSACIGVVVANGSRGQDLVFEHRALGAPVILEVRAEDVTQWKVARDK